MFSVFHIKQRRSRANAVSKSLQAAALLALAALCSPISQLNLSPVFGAIPASRNHESLTRLAVLLASIARLVLAIQFPASTAYLLPVLAFSTPTVQYFTFRHSSVLGATYGPLVLELMTYCPLVFLSVFVALDLLSPMRLSLHPRSVLVVGPSVAGYAFLRIAQDISTSFLRARMGSTFFFNRAGLQFALATLYAAVLPSRMLLFAILPVLHSALFNVHVPLARTRALLDNTLHSHGYSLVARRESLTGYISVIDNHKDGFRVMRCDHSLLGGEWLQRPRENGLGLREPIYAVFVMLEAVRLVQLEEQRVHIDIPDQQKQALIIGMGIGTTPAAFIAHGINTTIVEIDPIVYQFASTHFGLPKNHHAVIDDAISYVRVAKHAASERERFDYIIHDVFTGGAEPADLFTFEFLTDLSDMLKPDGVIAINYAGDLLLPSAKLVISTIESSFPSCRIFREVAPPPSNGQSDQDFTNVVIFCTKRAGRLQFRDPVEADFLGSGARMSYLLPRHEIDAASLRTTGGDLRLEPLRRGQTQRMHKWQEQSAVGHWGIMRTVLPAVVWENW